MKENLFLTHVGSAGGAELKVIRICEGLNKESLEFVCFQNGPIEQTLKDRDINSSILLMPESLNSFRREEGIIPCLKAIPSALKMIRRLARKCREYNRIICVSQKSFILAAIAKPIHRKPIIWFMNDILSKDHFSKPLIILLTKIFRYAPDHVIVNSEASRQSWFVAGGRRENVHVIYPGNDIEAIDAQLRDKKKIDEYKKQFSPRGLPVIGIFGRLSSWKGQDIFIKALAEVEGVKGVIVGGALFGEESYEEGLKELAANMGLGNKLHFAGHISDVVKAMAACDIVVHCSTAPEPFGSVITEAQLAGTPVIVSKAGGAQEIVIDYETGLLTPPGDVSSLVNAIKFILESPDKAEDMVVKGRNRVLKKYSVSKMIDDFNDVLKACA